MQRLLELSEARQQQALDLIVGYRDDLGRIPTVSDDGSPSWKNQWLIGLDTASLYSFVRSRSPRRYVEVGSGQSTRVVRQAVVDSSCATLIRSIDPEPRAGIDSLCDEVIRDPLELTDVAAAFGDVDAGDIVFFDGSHRVLPGSDCVVFFLEVLPSLPPGVLVGIHDIYLPDDYPTGFFELAWSEQYALAATLLADAGRRYVVELACYWASGVAELASRLDPLWAQPNTTGVNRRGSAFWFSIA